MVEIKMQTIIHKQIIPLLVFLTSTVLAAEGLG